MGIFGAASVSHAAAQDHARDGVAVYWRPGCPFCLGMRAGLLGKADRVAWVNIWEDPEARAWVASVNNGDEVVPTVVIDGAPHTSPSAVSVRRRLG